MQENKTTIPAPKSRVFIIAARHSELYASIYAIAAKCEHTAARAAAAQCYEDNRAFLAALGRRSVVIDDDISTFTLYVLPIRAALSEYARVQLILKVSELGLDVSKAFRVYHAAQILEGGAK